MKRYSLAAIATLLLTSGCEIHVPPNVAQQNDPAAVPQTQTSSYEEAEPMGTGAMPAHMHHMNQQMVEQLGEGDESYEKRFIDMMIPHHEGAVQMAKHALEHANRDQLKQMAQKMIAEQQQEIERLKVLRQQWYSGNE